MFAQVRSGTLPDIMYHWMPASEADAKQESGEMIIVVWTDIKKDTQHYISHHEMPDALLMAYRAQWDEALSGSRGQTLH